MTTASPAWTNTEVKTLIKLRLAGVGYREIGFRLGRTERSCLNKANKIGIPKQTRARRATCVLPAIRTREIVAKIGDVPLRNASDIIAEGYTADRSDEEPIFAPLEEVAAFAQRYRIPFRGWDDLRAVNEARDRLLLPRFARSLACHARRAA